MYRFLIYILLNQALICSAQTFSENQEDKETAMTECDKVITKSISLKEVAVSATESLKSRSASSVIIADKKEIEQQIPLNVSEVLQNHSGFTMKDSYQTPITLRGMSGKRLLTLRNGLRRMSSYPAGYMAHMVNVYDLDRIEVEKGYASVIYGAGAIAGTINLIDKPLFIHQGFHGKISYGSASNNAENSALACAGWNNKRWAYKGGLRLRKSSDFKYTNGDRAINSAYQDQDFFFASGFKISELESISVAADWHNGGPWGKPVGFNGSDYMKISTNKELSHNYQLHYRRKSKKQEVTLDLKGFYSNEKRMLQKAYYTAANYSLSYTETTNYADYYYGSKALVYYTPTSQHSFIAGSEGYAYHITTPTDGIDYIQAISFSNRVSHNARLYQGALFAEHRFYTSQKLAFKGGLRYDYAKLYEGQVHDSTAHHEMSNIKSAISGHLALDYKWNKSRIKVNLAHAFRMPSTNEMYTDSYTANGIIYATPDLEAEYCNSLDIVYRYYSNETSFEISPFVWMMDNMISKTELRGLPGTNYKYVNIGKTLLCGGELNLHLPICDLNLFSKESKLNLTCGIAYLYGNDISNKEHIEPLDYIPPFNIKTNLRFRTTIGKDTKLTCSLRSTYYSEQQRVAYGSYSTPNYHILSSDFTLDINQLKTQPTLNLSIHNLTNKNYFTYQSFIPSPGRNIKLMVSFHL